MMFNSFQLTVFTTEVLFYWFVFKKIKSQNIFVLTASYGFYVYRDVRFLSLILSRTPVIIVGTQVVKKINDSKRIFLLGLTLFCNLDILE